MAHSDMNNFLEKQLLHEKSIQRSRILTMQVLYHNIGKNAKISVPVVEIHCYTIISDPITWLWGEISCN